MKKVYVVLFDYGHEGLSSPDSIWDSLKRAETRKEELNSKGYGCDVEIYDYELNKVDGE
jgi:hypothetical protein